MLGEKEIISTLEMIRNENLDVRTVTLGINLDDCHADDIERFCDNVRDKIRRKARSLHAVCDRVSRAYGIPVVNKRISVSPMAVSACNFSSEQMVQVAKTLDSVAAELGVDFIGGFSALVQKGFTAGDKALIEAIPRVLSETDRVCSSINIASTQAGINMDAALWLGQILKQTADATKDAHGIGCAKLCVFANMPEDMPFMAGAYRGVGEPDTVVNVGVSGPGVVRKALERTGERSLGELSEVIKTTAFRVTRVGELIGREVASELEATFGVLDLSLAPTPNVGDSVGEIFEELGLTSIGCPGSTAALAMLNDAVKKGGAFASSSVGGLSGAFVPVSEDLNIGKAAAEGYLSIEKLEAMTSVCSVGLDMIALPGSVTKETLAGIIADEMAIGMVNKKTTATRLIPVPGKEAGENAHFGGLLGKAQVMQVGNNGASRGFVNKGGRIPAPIQSLIN